ncbi:hypothetical protein [Spirosoma litoris]
MSVKKYSLQLPLSAFFFSFSLPKISPRLANQLIRITTWSVVFGIGFSLFALTVRTIWSAIV